MEYDELVLYAWGEIAIANHIWKTIRIIGPLTHIHAHVSNSIIYGNTSKYYVFRQPPHTFSVLAHRIFYNIEKLGMPCWGQGYKFLKNAHFG